MSHQGMALRPLPSFVAPTLHSQTLDKCQSISHGEDNNDTSKVCASTTRTPPEQQARAQQALRLVSPN